MRVLIIKTSSLGDVIHTLPAVTDLVKHYPHAVIDWVVEESFTELPRLHPSVNQVIPIALRRWRKNLFKRNTIKEIKHFWMQLRKKRYDFIVDAQGLLKSAVITRLAKLDTKNSSSLKFGRFGLDKNSSRGKYITWAYSKALDVPQNLHAISRLKLLFSKAFNYSYEQDILDYGLSNLSMNSKAAQQKPYLVFLHCTTWESKKWPVAYWRELIQLALDNDFAVKLNSGNVQEFAQAKFIAQNFTADRVEVMAPQSITKLIEIISNCQGVVCVDTGLGHLAAALDVKGVGIYGATNPQLTSILSNKFTNLAVTYPCAPCFLRNCNKADQSDLPPCYSSIPPYKVWQALLKT